MRSDTAATHIAKPSTAHLICRRQTKRFCAVASVDAQYRWCLTGTPIQNQLDDLASLIRFLKVPYLDNSFSFRSNITHPIEQGDVEGVSKLKSLLKCVCLRRTTSVLHLPEPKQEIRALEFSSMESEQYKNIAAEHRRAIDNAVSGNNTAQAYQGVCQAILRLRLFCNHGAFSLASNAQSPEETFSFLQQCGQATCACCFQAVDSVNDFRNSRSGIIAECSHLLCPDCTSQGDKPEGEDEVLEQLLCPVCGETTDFGRLISSESRRDQSRS